MPNIRWAHHLDVAADMDPAAAALVLEAAVDPFHVRALLQAPAVGRPNFAIFRDKVL